MTYNPSTDFSALWRNIAGVVSKVEMPTLDLVVAALARAGLLTVSVSATAPTVSQQTTAWLQTAVPSYSAEGTLQLWNGTAYEPATPALFLALLQASAGQNNVSWRTTEGAPVNTLGEDGDFAVRLDAPNGIYGPKVAGAWPAAPVPGTADVITSTSLDNTFGTDEGQLIYRGSTAWEALPIGADDSILSALGGVPTWNGLAALLDLVFSSAQGSLLYRDAGMWQALAPGTAGNVLVTGGPTGDPAWGPRTAEFPSGVVMLFQQSAAPTGWTKQTVLDDYGLRVTSGDVGTIAGTAFSTVFAQTAVGNHTLTINEMPSHSHGTNAVQETGFIIGGGSNTNTPTFAGASIDSQGGGLPHSHTVSLALSYVDVIIAQKD